MYKFIVEFIYLGLFVGYSKPSLEEFLIPLVGQLLALEYGMSYENRWYKFFLLFAVFYLFITIIILKGIELDSNWVKVIIIII